MRHPQDLLSAYVDGVLSDREAADVAAHLAECQACRETVADLRAVRKLLRTVRTPEPPADLPARLLESVGRTRRAVPAGRWAVAAAALLASLLLAKLPWIPAPSDAVVRDLREHAKASTAHPMGDVGLGSLLSGLLGERGTDEP
ncbi:hypothetical protein HRbin32_01739 [bacterium HR32]|jgi:anti-sigma factor RsiW|nr:hypothetical protein HRbin32_01739 [bacterium HR32]